MRPVLFANASGKKPDVHNRAMVSFWAQLKHVPVALSEGATVSHHEILNCRAGQARKAFFFWRKRSKKTLRWGCRAETDKSFLLLFYKKEALPFRPWSVP
jgi:hypothetical protein